MNKKVSVIIPNYNYARFLQRRIDCIVNQTITPAEIIFLDDCSTDDSLVVAEQILSQIDIPYRIIPNKTNQGVFKQWLKGIELIQYDYFWIAEADDYCELNFLETLLPAFDDQSVVIAYCRSKFINSDGHEIYDETGFKNKLFNTTRWDNDFLADGVDEATNYYAAINVSPNASAVLFNAKLLNLAKICSELINFSKIGDWMFYTSCLTNVSSSKIFYSSQQCNFHVRHDQSTWIESNNNHEPYILNESLAIYLFCIKNKYVNNSSMLHMMNFIILWFGWYNFNSETENLLSQFSSFFSDKKFYSNLKNHYNDKISNLKNHYNDKIHGVEKLCNDLQEIKSALSLDLSSRIGELNEIKGELNEIKGELNEIKSSKFWKIVTIYRKCKKLLIN